VAEAGHGIRGSGSVKSTAATEAPQARRRGLRAVAGRGDYAFIAPKPQLSGEPGERVATCTQARVGKVGNKVQVKLTFETDDGQLGNHWIEIPEQLTTNCKYMREVRVALGRDPKPGAPIHPGTVFEGKTFRVDVGWRKSRGKEMGDALAAEGPKDAKDFLRVHDLLERLE
jgi:hypothetical protein